MTHDGLLAVTAGAIAAYVFKGCMMSMLIMLTALMAAPPQEAALKPYHIYSQQARHALRAEATAEDQHQRANAIRKLAAIYEELKADPRLETSDTLTALKAKLWSRLTRVKKDIERDLARQREEARDRSANDAALSAEAEELLAAELNMASMSMSGPTALVGQSGAFGGGAVLADHGQTLVNLIERVIAPDKWDSVGGPFSIIYYAPLRALVVSATSEIHNDVGALLENLRRVGP